MDPRHLPPDFRDFLVCLNALGVEYLLVGGHAVAFHGYPRVTSDMDVWIDPMPDNAERALDAVSEVAAGPTPPKHRRDLTIAATLPSRRRRNRACLGHRSAA